MGKIIKPAIEGDFLKKGDKISIPSHEELLVEGFFKVDQQQNFSVLCRNSTGKLIIFSEASIFKYKKRHLRLINED